MRIYSLMTDGDLIGQMYSGLQVDFDSAAVFMLLHLLV